MNKIYLVWGLKDGNKTLIGKFKDLEFVFKVCGYEAANYEEVFYTVDKK